MNTIVAGQTALPNQSGREHRTDLSAVLGVDVDLVLGPVDEVPGSVDEYVRLCALRDILGDDPELVGRAVGRLQVLAAELELADDEAGYDLDDAADAEPAPAPSLTAEFIGGMTRSGKSTAPVALGYVPVRGWAA